MSLGGPCHLCSSIRAFKDVNTSTIHFRSQSRDCSLRLLPCVSKDNDKCAPRRRCEVALVSASHDPAFPSRPKRQLCGKRGCMLDVVAIASSGASSLKYNDNHVSSSATAFAFLPSAMTADNLF